MRMLLEWPLSLLAVTISLPRVRIAIAELVILGGVVEGVVVDEREIEEDIVAAESVVNNVDGGWFGDE